MHWLIWSEEHRGWWKPAHRGYTEKRSEAGKYTLEDAVEILRRANIHEHDVPNEAMVLAQPTDYYGK